MIGWVYWVPVASSLLSRIDVPFPFISRWRNGERTEDLPQTLVDHGTSFCVDPQRPCSRNLAMLKVSPPSSRCGHDMHRRVHRAISPKGARPRARLLSPWMTGAHSKWTFKRSSIAFYPTAALSPAHLADHQHRITIRQLAFLARLEGQCPEQFVAFVYRVHTFFAQGGFRLPVGA